MNAKFASRALALVFVCAAFDQTNAAPEYSTPSEPGIWLSRAAAHGCAQPCQEQLTASLRRLTGLSQLHFSAAGALVLCEQEAAVGGAAAARAILAAAFASGHRFVIEDHSASATVNFGQLDEGLKYEDTLSGRRLTIWRVRLDFADFAKMQAPPEVRAAFDPGFTLLHELLHGLGFKDGAHAAELGEVEERVNCARRELGLPLREQYFGSPLRQTPHFTTVRLCFQHGAPLRPQRRYLYFVIAANARSSAAGDCAQVE